MPTPGANRSRQVPKFEKEARLIVAADVAPTVSASAARDGI